MSYPGGKRFKDGVKAMREHGRYAVKTKGTPGIIAAHKNGVISTFLAAHLVIAGVRAVPLPLPVPATVEDAAWRKELHARGVDFFGNAAIAASAIGIADVLRHDGVAHLPASSFSAAASEFVSFLRTRAPEKTAGYKGATKVSDRIKWCVPSAYVLCPMLLAFARALRPECFPDTLTDDLCEISVIYLTLLETSKDQEWHHDYLMYKDAVVFLIMLDPGEGSTEFEVGGATKTFAATTGDVVPFNPRTPHRGVCTGVRRRAIYISIRRKVSRKVAVKEGKKAKASGCKLPTYETTNYADALKPPMGGL